MQRLKTLGLAALALGWLALPNQAAATIFGFTCAAATCTPNQAANLTLEVVESGGEASFQFGFSGDLQGGLAGIVELYFEDSTGNLDFVNAPVPNFNYTDAPFPGSGLTANHAFAGDAPVAVVEVIPPLLNGETPGGVLSAINQGLLRIGVVVQACLRNCDPNDTDRLYSRNAYLAEVPEPGGYPALLGMGLAGLWWSKRRRNRQA